VATVCVVGSLNMDLVVKVPRLPRVGETVSGGTFATFPGGKGANQAVAAARLEAEVAMVGAVGDDAFGRQLLQGLHLEGIDVTHIRTDPSAATGVASIGVDGEGRNWIVVASGANSRVTPDDVRAAEAVIAAARVVLLQLEIPLESVIEAATLAKAAGALVCLDPAPAPAIPLPDDLYALVDVINPNEVEAQTLTGIEVRSASDAERAAAALRGRGPSTAVIKMGEHGSFYLSGQGRGYVPALPVRPVDTTAAGDAFAAALGIALGEGQRLPEAVRFATRVAGIKVTRMGAQPAMPRRAEVEEAMRP
jgi:ribokinase